MYTDTCYGDLREEIEELKKALELMVNAFDIYYKGYTGFYETFTGPCSLARAVLEKYSVENEPARTKKTEKSSDPRQDLCTLGNDQPCFMCGEKINNLAGDPGRWGIPFLTAEEPGKVKPTHVGCVLKKITDIEKEVKFLQDNIS